MTQIKPNTFFLKDKFPEFYNINKVLLLENSTLLLPGRAAPPFLEAVIWDLMSTTPRSKRYYQKGSLSLYWQTEYQQLNN